VPAHRVADALPAANRAGTRGGKGELCAEHPMQVRTMLEFIPLILLLSAASAEADAKAPGPLVFDRESVDFGEVAGGQVCETLFRFHNAGSRDAVGLDVKVSCACTVVGETPSRVRPGKHGSFAVKLNTAGKRDVVQSICLVTYSVDSETFVRRLLVTARVATRGELLAEPQDLYLGNVSAGASLERTIRLSQRPGSREQIRVEGVKGPSWLRLDLKRRSPSAAEWDLVVRGVVPRVHGSLNDRIVVSTDAKRDPERIIGVSAFVEGAVQLQPSCLVRVVRKSGEPRFPLLLRGPKGSTLTVVSAKLDADSDQSVLVEPGDGSTPSEKTVIFTPSFSGIGEKKMLKGAVIVSTRLGEVEEIIRIPFLFMQAE